MKFDFLASQAHWGDHLRPIWEALEPTERGDFGRMGSGRIIVTASSSDFRQARARGLTRPVVLFEHGAGFSFADDKGLVQGSYAGGAGREKAALLPAPNHWVQARNAVRYPDIPGPIVGCPKLDRMLGPPPRDGVVAISFHWHCQVVPETDWALMHYKRVLPVLAKRYEGRIIGHGHPKSWYLIAPWFRRWHIPTESSFSEVVRRASVYVNDASSTLYEFAALGRPVVVLNAPTYRRDVHHGLRFWEHADVGVQVNEPADVVDAIEEAFEDRPEQRARREAAVAEVYPYLGHSTDRAVAVLRQLAEQEQERADLRHRSRLREASSA